MSDTRSGVSKATFWVLTDVGLERHRQDEKWGEQNHPDGTGPSGFHRHISGVADRYRSECDAAARAGKVTFRHIFLEEVFEAMAEHDPGQLRAELVQVAAVAVAWVEAIDRRRA